MSFDADKKRDYAAQADAAIKEGDYRRAAVAMAKTAEFALKLADRSEGAVRANYIAEARELVEIAEELQQKAPPRRPGRKAVREAGDEDDKPGTNWELQERPTERLADVAGLDDVKTVLQEKVIIPFQKPELFERFKARVGAGVLMYGPPGNGKTFVARAIAGELEAAFFPVDTSQIKDKYVGETEKNLKKLFDEARSHERAVIFLDEVDNLLSKRGNRKIGAVAQFLALSDGLVKGKTCLLILAATNKPWSLDEAVIRPGRLGTHVYVGPPDAKAREAILAYGLKGVPAAGDVVFADLAGKTDGYSGADMAEVCDRAKMGALRRQLASGKEEVITAEDFAAALMTIKPSVTPAMLKEYEVWRDTREKPGDGDDEAD
jgi:SpoVK/Ycf46/Vps4 family AAA+-type ATPase